MKQKCEFEGCSKKVNIVLGIGLCQYCRSNFCNSHRLVEEHQCKDMHRCKEDAKNKNAMKLMNEKCVSRQVEVL